jgi:hypothetical protein
MTPTRSCSRKGKSSEGIGALPAETFAIVSPWLYVETVAAVNGGGQSGQPCALFRTEGKSFSPWELLVVRTENRQPFRKYVSSFFGEAYQPALLPCGIASADTQRRLKLLLIVLLQFSGNRRKGSK